MRFLRALAPLAFVASACALVACGQSGTGAASTSTGTGSTTMSTSSSGTGGSIPGQKITILDWNTHNFFDDKKNGGSAETVVSASEYKTHKHQVGSVLATMDADIVMLAEVENQGVVDALNKDELGGKYAYRKLIDGNDPRGIDVAVLSKIQFDDVVSHAKDTFKRNGTNGPEYSYVRDCLEVHFTINGKHVITLGVHFRAKGPPDDPDKRLAEAQHTRKIANDLMAADPGALIVVLGDMNDLSASEPVTAIVGKDFVDSADSVDSAGRWTYNFNGKQELIDHQIANAGLHALLDPAGVVIRHGKDVDTASDHAPIMATYEIK
jgi:endonuclease/exonuclease/phosphatase family metal-dependent hydrolase